ncbi:MAG TPA: proline dehydrogenase family protein [Thermoanaerobaculia bacterium]|nr:proline dehydrogenase family protein [Thermoanaerobaculia bacterium]
MSLLRKVFLAASESRWLRERAVKVPFVRRAVRKFMPGETIDDALTASRALGVGTVLTRLGENLKSAGEAEGVARHYLEVLDRVAAEKLDVEISVKLTQLGLDFSREECERHLHDLAERARSHGNCLWVDMESTAYTDVTLDIYRRLRSAFPNTGLCVQSYLYRTAADVESLVSLGSGIRLVKGAYLEPPDRAYPKKEDVDASYFRIAERLLSEDAREKGVRAIFGTHDPALIQRIEEVGRSRDLASKDVEFQMLYGIRRVEQLRLIAAGYRFRVLISYGEAWFAWYMRRLAERPANVLFVVKSLFGG